METRPARCENFTDTSELPVGERNVTTTDADAEQPLVGVAHRPSHLQTRMPEMCARNIEQKIRRNSLNSKVMRVVHLADRRRV